MGIPQTAAEVLSEHVKLEVECIDRMYLNVYVPQLQRENGVAYFLKSQKGQRFASGAAMDPISKKFIASIDKFAKENEVPVIRFEKGQRKDDVAHEYLKKFKKNDGVLFIGKAQEKARVFRTEKRRNPTTGQPYPWLVSATSIVNQFYFYCLDENFGPFFLKFSSYFPYNAKLCLNGHEYVKQQLKKKGIAFEALDNGVLSCEQPKQLQKICDGLDEEKINTLLRKWLRKLPHPFTPADRKAGYLYDVSILQAEFSLTQVLGRPLCGRIFFEDVIRENLDAGRPNQVQLIFNRKVTKRTPGKFRTRVITEGVTPSLHLNYKNSKIKQYHKEGRALRTETTVNNTRDFDIGKRLQNLPALKQVGFSANRRLLDVQKISHDSAIGEDTFNHVTNPLVQNGQRASALRFGNALTHALLSLLLYFGLQPNGFKNIELRELLAPLLGKLPSELSQGAMTYHLRRLRLHGLIERLPGTHRYRVTSLGMRAAHFLNHIHNRQLRPILARINPIADAGPPSDIRNLYHQLDSAIESQLRKFAA